MTKAEKERIERLLNYLQDKVDPVYEKETQRAIERFLSEIK